MSSRRGVYRHLRVLGRLTRSPRERMLKEDIGRREHGRRTILPKIHTFPVTTFCIPSLLFPVIPHPRTRPAAPQFPNHVVSRKPGSCKQTGIRLNPQCGSLEQILGVVHPSRLQRKGGAGSAGRAWVTGAGVRWTTRVAPFTWVFFAALGAGDRWFLWQRGG